MALPEIDGFGILKNYINRLAQGEGIPADEIKEVQNVFVATGGWDIGKVIRESTRWGTIKWEGKGDGRKLVSARRTEQP